MNLHSDNVPQCSFGRRMLQRARASAAAELRTWCDDCSAPHSFERRAAIVRRLLPATTAEIRASVPHFYGDVEARGDVGDGSALLRRDLRRIGAVRARGIWSEAMV
jgi:hypothetical protein